MRQPEQKQKRECTAAIAIRTHPCEHAAHLGLTNPLALRLDVAQEGEIKSVPVGFWRNYLQPTGVAKIADASILA